MSAQWTSPKGSTVVRVPVRHQRKGRGSAGDEPNTIVVLGARIVRRLGVKGAMSAMETQSLTAGKETR